MAATAELMDRGLMKRLLVKSKQEPVACAVATAADGKSGLLLLDKIKQGKALERELVKSEPDAKNPRFGRAFVDTDEDPKLVKFMLNKPASGLARRLVKVLKGTGFNKVEICGEDGAVLESSGAEAEDEAGDDDMAATPAAAETVQPAASPTQVDAEKVQQLIRGLLPQVQSFTGDPAIRVDMIANLQKANALLKVNEPDDALAAARLVAKALAGGGAKPQDQAPETTAASGPVKLSPVKLGKASLLWRGMWAKANKDLATLRDVVLGEMMHNPDVDPGDYGEIESNLQNVTKITEELNVALADELDDLRNATPEKAAAPLQKLEQRLSTYETYLETDEWVGMLGDNEFHPISIQADLLKAVRVIRDALKPATS